MTARVFQGPPALHRYSGSMAARAQEVCRALVTDYDGQAAGDYGQEGSRRSVADITGPEFLARVRTFEQEQKQAAKAARQATGN